MLRKEELEIVYLGDLSPGTRRIISPGLIFQVEAAGPIYVSGFCQLRSEMSGRSE